MTIAFFGLATAATSMLLTPLPGAGTAAPRQEARPGEPERDGGGHADGAAVAVRARGQARQVLTRGEPSAWMVVPVLAGLAVLVLLGLHPPGELTDLITRGVAQLGGSHDDHAAPNRPSRPCGRRSPRRVARGEQVRRAVRAPAATHGGHA